MEDREIRAALDHHWAASDANDFEAEHQIYREDAVLEYPFIRTLKENLLWVRIFETVEELRLALLKVRHTYNTTWLIERRSFIAPATVRQNQLHPAALAA